MTVSDRIRDGSVLATAAERTVDRLRTAAATARVGRLLPQSIRSRSARSGSSEAAGDGDENETAGESRIGVATRRSTVATALEFVRTSLESAFRTATPNARLTAAGGTVRRFVRGSFCYRWLTTEPEPDVIVIDLRETATVGPPLRAIQRALEALAPSVASARLTDALRAAASALRARPIRIASLSLLGAVGGSVAALAVSGDPEPAQIALLVGLAVLAAVGMRSTAPWEDVRESRVLAALAAAFEPPDPPDRTDTADEDESRTPRSSNGRDVDDSQ